MIGGCVRRGPKGQKVKLETIMSNAKGEAILVTTKPVLAANPLLIHWREMIVANLADKAAILKLRKWRGYRFVDLVPLLDELKAEPAKDRAACERRGGKGKGKGKVPSSAGKAEPARNRDTAPGVSATSNEVGKGPAAGRGRERPGMIQAQSRAAGGAPKKRPR